jgi:hypothetical protein
MPPPSPTLVAASPPSLTLVHVPPRKVGAKHASPDVLAGFAQVVKECTCDLEKATVARGTGQSQ